MANRSRLHKNKLFEFIVFAQKQGCEIFPTKGYDEALRIKKDGKFVIFYEKNGCDHITSKEIDGGTRLVNKFLAWKKSNE